MTRRAVRRARSKGRKDARARKGAPRRRSSKTLLAATALAKAMARAQASLKANLTGEPAVPPRDMADEALEEAEEIGMLLDEPEEDEEGPGSREEEEYFIKAPAQAPGRPRVRPAPGIVARRTGRSREKATAPAPLPTRAPAKRKASNIDSSHLFPRNLRTDYPVAVRGEGVWIHDDKGRKYLDGCSGAVVCSIGHGVEEIATVMAEQASRLAFAHSSQFITREAMELAARIAALAPGDMRKTGRVYLVSGGSEAIETALKLARQYHVETGHPSKFKIISRWQSYHGSTLGALAATGHVPRRAPYTPLLAGTPHIPPCYCYRCPYGLRYPSCGIACVEDLEAAIHQEGPETVAAFLAEPVVGATLGAVPAVDGYWARARDICAKHNVLLIADEVMTGVGRTGKNFALDHFGVVPDLLVLGKGLSGGYTPLGAVIARGFIADAIRAGRGYFEHGFTYGANPLSAAVGRAVLDYVARNRLVARAARLGKVLGEKLQGLRHHRIVGDVRGLGMMWGVELVRVRSTREPFPADQQVARRLYEACLEEGLLIYPGSGAREGQDGDHLLIAPPLTITRAEIDDLVARLDRGLTKLTKTLR